MFTARKSSLMKAEDTAEGAENADSQTDRQ